MSITLKSLLALFPNHFSRRGDDYPTGQGDRAWKTLELGRVRVVGPFWSIVIKTKKLETGAFDISLLSEREEVLTLPVKNDENVAHHPASAFATTPRGIYTSETQFHKRGNSRLSLIAVASYVDVSQNELALPFVDEDGDSNGSELLCDAQSIVLQPLGRLPEHDANEARKFLTAMRLSAGVIKTRARATYLGKLRKALNLHEPSEAEDMLYFMPDGIGFRAIVALPWQDKNVEFWMRLGHPEGDTSRGELRVWEGPDPNKREPELENAVETLIKRITLDEAHGPRWLSLETIREFSPANLVWPTTTENNSVLQRRMGKEAWIEGRGIQLRLGAEGDGSGADQMTLLLPRLKLSGTTDLLTISAEEDTPNQPEDALPGANATYSFLSSKPPTSQDPGTLQSEKVSIGSNGSGGTATQANFVLPALSMAQELAAKMDIDPPKDPSLLWGFTPLSNGWLHWPLPHATIENIYELVRDKKPPVRQSRTITSGRFQMGPAIQDAGNERPWQLTLSRASSVILEIVLSASRVEHATVDLGNAAVSLDGLLPFTPFRQTPERILPGGRERSLLTQGLTGVTENQLSDLEAKLLQAGLGVRVALTNLKAAATSQGAASLDLSSAAALEFSLPTSETGTDLNWLDFAQELRPWIWLRHSKLPMVQEVSLSETGGAEGEPSSNRELAPFVLDASTEPVLELAFSTLTNMREEAPTLRTEGRRAKRPTYNATWLDEAGMVPTTLSGVIVTPGLKRNMGERLPNDFWAGLATSSTFILRHDIPNSDGLWTQTKFPLPVSGDEKEEVELRPPLGFSPLPHNGPDDNRAGLSSWRGMWASRNRSLALAALDRNEVVSYIQQGEDEEPVRVAANILGDMQYPLSAIAFSQEIVLDQEALEPALSRVGSVSLSIDRGNDTTRTYNLHGLPDVSSLEEIAGTFIRSNDNEASIRFGSLRAGPGISEDLSDTLMDQLGLTVHPTTEPSIGSAYAIRNIEINRPGQETGEKWLLYSLLGPYKLDGFSLVLLDIPFSENETTANLEDYWRDKNGAWRTNAIAHAAPQLNHLAGYSWNIYDDDRTGGDIPDGMFYRGGWLVSPRALLSVTLDDDSNLSEATIACQIFTRARTETGQVLIPTDGELVIGIGDRPSIEEYRNVYIPVSDPSMGTGDIPVIKLGDRDNSVFEFALGSQTFRVKGEVNPFDSPKLFSRTLRERTEKNRIFLKEVSSRFDPDELDEEWPSAHATFDGKTQLSGLNGDEETSLNLDLDFSVDLLRQKIDKGFVTFDLYGTTLKCRLRPSSRFEGKMLALDFELNNKAKKIFGLTIQGVKGTLLAKANLDDPKPAVESDNPAVEAIEEKVEKLPEFGIQGKSLMLIVSLGEGDGKSDITLHVNTIDAHGRAFLSGTIVCESVYKWPELQVNDSDATWTPGSGFTDSSAIALFEQAELPIVQSKAKSVRAQCSVTHTLGDFSFSATQTVALYGNKALDEYIKSLADDNTSVVPSAPPTDGKPEHLQKSIEASLPGGIGPKLRQKLATILKTNKSVGAVDFSGHHWLNNSNEQAIALPLALPFIAVMGKEVEDPIKTPDENQLYSICPPGTLNVGRRRPSSQERSQELNATPGRFAFVPRSSIDEADPQDEILERCLRVDVGVMLSKLTNTSEVQRVHSLARDGAVKHQLKPSGAGNTTNPWELQSGKYKPSTYFDVWRTLKEETGSHLVSASASNARTNSAESDVTWRIRIYVLTADGETVDLIATASLESSPSEEDVIKEITKKDGAWPTWVKNATRRVKPNAKHAVIFLQKLVNGEAVLRFTKVMDVHSGNGRPETAVERRFAIQDAQGQLRRDLRPKEVASRSTMGFAPYAITPVAVTSDNPHQDGISQNENRLSATGYCRALRISGQDQRIITDDAWIVSREQLAFRNSGMEDMGKQRLYPALPPNSRAALSTAFVPVTQGSVQAIEAKGEEWEHFVPAYLEETTIGGRPGSWTVSRHSIETVHRTDLPGKSTLSAGKQFPIWAKDPRPIELGMNDRTRASSHESGHMEMTWHPSAIVHGPAGPASTEPVGLDRSPRSLWAFLLDISVPESGIFPIDWDGTITLEGTLLGGQQTDEPDESEGPGLIIHSATLDAPGLKLRWQKSDKENESAETVKRDIEHRGTKVLSGFKVENFGSDEEGDAQALETASVRLNRLPSATPVRLSLQIDAGGITRLVVFDLLTGSKGRGLPTCPLYVRFDDPAYNDRIGGLAKLNRIDTAAAGTELVFASDANELRTGDFVTFAIGMRETGKGDDPELPENFQLSLWRRRPGEDKAEPLDFPPLSGEVDDDWEKNLPFTCIEGDDSSATVGVLLSELRLRNPEASGPPLEPGDRLEARAKEGLLSIRLRFDVVTRPNLPENATFYGVHKLEYDKDNTDTAIMSVPISGFGLAPTTIELVDPRELLRGSVRRRANYVWQMFENRQSEASERIYALQKRTLIGASWLPSAIETDWVNPDQDRILYDEIDEASDVPGLVE